MTFAVYEQSTGRFVICSIDDGGIERVHYETTGYAGRGFHKNRPQSERISSYGPIPRGFWRVGRGFTHPRLGKLAFRLDAMAHTRTYGRGGFLIHGDSTKAPGNASHGCIILSRSAREAVEHFHPLHVEVIDYAPHKVPDQPSLLGD